MKAYLVFAGEYSDRMVMRVYLDREEAYEYVERYNALHSSSYGEGLDIEEHGIGCAAEYDGPGFWGHWRPGQEPFVRASWYTGPAIKAKVRHWKYGIDVSGMDKDYCLKALHDAIPRFGEEEF